jgi:hypothetical protein
MVMRSPITPRITSKRFLISGGTSGWLSYVEGSFGRRLLAIGLTLGRRVGARKFSVPPYGAIAPAVVGIEVADGLSVVRFFEPGEGASPPVVERRPGFRPRF